MPLVYERAFGGTMEGVGAFEPRNPVGTGFWSGRPTGEVVGKPVPNLEYPRQLLQAPEDSPPPAGFGPVAPSWLPRVGFAGTYDRQWQRTQAPLLPADFDTRFFNVAPPDLTFPGHLQGGEPVQVSGVSAAGPLSFNLPVCRPVATVALGQDLQRPPFFLERVHIDAREERLCLLWRAALPCDKQAMKIRAVHVALQELS